MLKVPSLLIVPILSLLAPRFPELLKIPILLISSAITSPELTKLPEFDKSPTTRLAPDLLLKIPALLKSSASMIFELLNSPELFTNSLCEIVPVFAPPFTVNLPVSPVSVPEFKNLLFAVISPVLEKLPVIRSSF